MQSLHQNRVQGFRPYMGFIHEKCEEKEKWVEGEGCESQMCSCQKWNNICLNELT